MATKSNPKIISKAADSPLAGALIVLYGIGGVGKTTAACQAPGPALVLDCADGAAGKGADRWLIVTTADFREAVSYLKAGGHGYKTVILDGYDFLYARTVQAAPVNNDRRARNLHAQETLHPVLYDFLALTMLKVLVLNERKKIEERSNKKLVMLDLAPRAAELVDNAAHVLARCEWVAGKPDTTIRVRRVDSEQMAIPAKSRFDTLKDGDRLAELWAKLGAAKPASNGKPTDPTTGEVGNGAPQTVIPTNLAEAMRFLNHQIGIDPFFRTTDHLANVLRKHGDGTPVDGDTKGWEQAVAIALAYANDQQNAPAPAGAGK